MKIEKHVPTVVFFTIQLINVLGVEISWSWKDSGFQTNNRNPNRYWPIGSKMERWSTNAVNNRRSQSLACLRSCRLLASKGGGGIWKPSKPCLRWQTRMLFLTGCHPRPLWEEQQPYAGPLTDWLQFHLGSVYQFSSDQPLPLCLLFTVLTQQLHYVIAMPSSCRTNSCRFKLHGHTYAMPLCPGSK